MAQTGYTPILIYGSTTPGNTPTAGNLTTSVAGVELALNAADGKLFYKDSGGVVKVLASQGTGTIGGSNTQIQFNNSGAFGGSASLTWDGTTFSTSAETVTGAVLHSATTANLAYGSSQTSGTWTAGGAAQTGAITLDQSTKTHTLSIATGATENAAIKTINFGTGGVSGSTTAITIGSTNGTTTTLNGTVTAATFNSTTIDTTNLEVTNIKAKDGTASMTLADATGVASFSANPTLSAGTANGVTYLNGSKVLTSGSALTFDGNRLTVSSATPSIRIDDTNATGAFGIDWYFSSLALTRGNITLDGSTGEMQFQSGASGSAGYYQTFFLNGSEQMRLTSTGLGIGTSSPAGKLQVSSNNPAVYITDNSVSAPDSAALYLGIGVVTDYAGLIADFSNDRLNIRHNSATRATFDSSGNLGIGTSSPISRLHVNSATSNITYSTTGNNNGGTQIGVDAAGLSIVSAFSANPIRFGNNSGSTFAETMRLDSSGNLGLGVTPSAVSASDRVLQVRNFFFNDNTNGYGILRYNNYFNGSNDVYLNTGAVSAFQMQGNAFKWYQAPSGTAGNAISFTQAMTLDASGNLSVIATSPVFAATNRGNITVGGSASSLLFLGTGTTTGTYITHTQSTATAEIWNTANGPMLFATNNTERARITSGGDFGVGTNTINYRVVADCGGATNNDNGIAVRNENNSGYGGSYNFEHRLDTGGSIVRASYISSEGGVTNSFLRFGTTIAGSLAERARITSGGDLLVGTTDNALTTGIGFKFIYSATNPYSGIVFSGTTNTETNLHLYSTGAGAYRFYVGGAGTVYATNTTISAISDQRLKENIRDLDDGLSAVMALQPRKFDWKAGKGKDIKGDRGFIAQEFEQVFPDLIDEWKDPAPEGEAPYKAVNANLIPTLVKAIQELKAELDSVKAELATLKGQP
jgi:hypothetical protein